MAEKLGYRRLKIIRTFLKNRSAVAGMIMVMIILPVAFLSPLIAPYDPIEQNVELQLKAPDRDHTLGTDSFGRDMLSRILVGGRVSLTVGILSVLLGMFIGSPFGLLAGYYGGKLDMLITRAIDILMSFPTLLMGLMVLAILGPGMNNLIISIALAFAPRFARMARAPTISIKEQDFVMASRALGMNDYRIMFRHILPNIVGDISVMATLWTATAIRLEANLSFIGIGVQPPTPSWGVMIRTGVDYLTNAPWISIYSGIAILITVLSFNMIGDGLRDVIDPKLRT
ncbi:MAG: ABC transporter permease [Deltaproteobacteria bacterium]|nr:ABC transporter permease [Deltaproteobacteria bacterium]